MQKRKRTYLLFFLLTAPLILATFSYNRNERSFAQQVLQERGTKLPIVDYDAPESKDKVQREKRRKKGRKYNNAIMPVRPSDEVVTSTSVSHWFYGIPPLPTAQSDVLILGEVVNAEAFLSPDKTGVYSEYSVRVDEVFKTDDPTMTPGQMISMERSGGRVRLQSGLVQSYNVLNQGVPCVGCKYVFFLNRSEQDLRILTGYELRQGKVKPLDKVNLFAVYKNEDIESFMDELRQAVISPQSPPSAEYSMLPIDTDPPDPDPSGTPCAAPTPGPCTKPLTIGGGAATLKPNQEYTVTINPTGFTQEKLDAIQRGFEQWNAVSGANGTNTGIRFVGFSPSTQSPPASCNYCVYVEGVTDLHDSQGRKADATTGWQAASNTYPYISLATMRIDLSVPLTHRSFIGCPTGQSWSYNALEPTVAHEMGHPQGLNDCYPGCTGSSIMGANDPKVQSPTPCDIQAVKEKYAPPVTGGGGGDDGAGGTCCTPCAHHWDFWPVYNRENEIIGFEWDYAGCF